MSSKQREICIESFGIFGIVGMQATFEISCVSIDPVTILTVNSEAHSNPGMHKGRKKFILK